MTEVTDDDVRAELRGTAVLAAQKLRLALEGKLRAACNNDAKEEQSVLRGCEVTLQCWAKSLPQKLELTPGERPNRPPVEIIREALRDPDDDLKQALLAEGPAVRALLDGKKLVEAE